MFCLFLVTVWLPARPDRNPHNKITGPCPLNGEPCTDITGEHHTLALWAPVETDAEEIRDTIPLSQWPGARVTRVETTRVYRPDLED